MQEESSDSPAASSTSNRNATEDDNSTWGPSLPKPLEKYLPFEPDFTIFLGSPVGLFLTLRGAHPVFDSIRAAHPDHPIVTPFNLPTRAMYNIYSPSDPVAYRIEPLLLPQDIKDFPEAEYVTRQGEGVRLHVKAMKLGDEITKVLSKQRSSLSLLMSAFSDHASSVLQHVDDANETSTKKAKSDALPADGHELRFPLAGRGGRLDYQLQPRVIDSEYISAVTAHSSYFQNTDVTDFVMDLVQRKEHFIDLTGETIATIDDCEMGRTTSS